MRERMRAMREALHATLVQKMPARDFDYFLTQRGMFSYTGLGPAQVDRLRDEFAVYLVRSGRMCVAGLNSGNVEATVRRAEYRPPTGRPNGELRPETGAVRGIWRNARRADPVYSGTYLLPAAL